MGADPRNRVLAAIHCARRDLKLDEDTYRDMLEKVAGVRSAKDLDDAGRQRVLDHMRSLGALKATAFPRQPKNMHVKLELTKVEALLAESKLSWAYADAIAKQMFRIQRVQWLDAVQLRAVITALVKRAEKAKAT